MKENVATSCNVRDNRVEMASRTTRSSYLLLLIRAYILLIVIDWKLKFRTFDAAHDWMLRAAKAKSSWRNDAAPSTAKAIDEVHDVVEKASRFYYRTQRDCLPAAILAYYLMRKIGIPVSFCMGVKKFPFAGHAWVEYEDRVVFTTPANVEAYRVILKV